MDTNIADKLETRMLKMLARINFISWTTFSIGILILLASGFFYYISSNNPQFQFLLYGGTIGFTVCAVGLWMNRRVRVLRKARLSPPNVDHQLMVLAIATLLVGAIIGLSLLYFAPLWGIAVSVIFFLLIIDVMRFRALVWRTRHNPTPIINSSKPTFNTVLKIALWLGLMGLGIWLVVALGPLWIIAIILLLILLVLANR